MAIIAAQRGFVKKAVPIAPEAKPAVAASAKILEESARRR
jgi:hypothetical protein